MRNPDVLGLLFEAADDYEADTLEAVAIKAGLLWKCGCRWTTRADLGRCCGCNAKRPEPAPVTPQGGK